ncbi:exo-alpha-sialidase [Chitinophaga polysaccharea]|uniref:sialidase family protein n=1 Tax=Chitinophaga polysaccharea TaxID=1293035 RepID=UPI0014556A61|nr:sialidase family protein [Chitinophaga polysaccharea]NLR62421.1 exo-alpha-sialidase [Chitinophaga polysaccharea]
MKIVKTRCCLLMIAAIAVAGGCRSTRTASAHIINESHVVFEPDDQYASMRIPALVLTQKQTLLAFCEARIGTASDWANMNLVMRRSTDGGKTWSEINILDTCRTGPAGNPTPIVDDKGVVHLLYQKDYKDAWYIRSEDDGKSWSQPENITAVYDQFKPAYSWNVLAPGPGHGIQLSSGRLLAAVWLANSRKLTPRRSHGPSCVATIYSDDHGKTWHSGAIVADSSARMPNPSESQPVELSDHRVLLSMRNPAPVKRRAFSESKDGITGWSPVRYESALFDPTCMASIVHVKDWRPEGKPALVFVNPDTRDIEKHPRANLTASVSFDDGNTWNMHEVLDSGPAGYSDMAAGPDGTIYCLYETNTQQNKGFNYSLVLKKFNTKWLQQTSKK